MKLFVSVCVCKYRTSQDQCQTSFSNWEFLVKTAWLLTPVVTFTNSRLVAAHRRKQAVTKMNDGGCRSGRASGEMGSLSISKFHFQIDGVPPNLRAPHPPTIYLTAWGSWWLWPNFWWICLCQSLSAQPLQVGSCNKHVHLPDFPPQLKRNEKKAVKLHTQKKKKSPNHNFRGMKSNIW